MSQGIRHTGYVTDLLSGGVFSQVGHLKIQSSLIPTLLKMKGSKTLTKHHRFLHRYYDLHFYKSYFKCSLLNPTIVYTHHIIDMHICEMHFYTTPFIDIKDNIWGKKTCPSFRVSVAAACMR